MPSTSSAEAPTYSLCSAFVLSNLSVTLVVPIAELHRGNNNKTRLENLVGQKLATGLQKPCHLRKNRTEGCKSGLAKPASANTASRLEEYFKV